MIDHIDFAPIKVRVKHKCFTRNCLSSPKDMPFYLTEWEFSTGASSDRGLVYCEKCVLKHLGKQ